MEGKGGISEWSNNRMVERAVAEAVLFWPATKRGGSGGSEARSPCYGGASRLEAGFRSRVCLVSRRAAKNAERL